MTRPPRGVLVLAALLSLLVACAPFGGHSDSTSRGGAQPPAASAGSEGTAATPAGRPPNIVLLMTDDQSLSDLDVMPRTRRLIGAEGATFDRAVSTYPLCCPARTTVLTGLHAHNHQVLGNELPWGGYERYRGEDDSLPIWLQQAGYDTVMLGKYLNGYVESGRSQYVPPGWSDWFVPTTGTYNYLDYDLNENGVLRHQTQYQSTYLADRAVEIIRGRDRDKPLFLWASFLAPHVGAPVEADDPRARDPDALDTPAVEPQYRDAMAGRPLPDGPAITETDLSDKSSFLREQPTVDLLDAQELHEQRLESLLSVDDAVGRVVGELEAEGIADETLVVFVSDNGFQVGEHRWVGKVLGYEPSIRVPLLVRGPGIAAGARVSQLVSLADLTATLVDVAGAEPGYPLDGVPLGPMVADPSLLADRALPLEAGGYPDPDLDRLYTGVRTADDHVMLRWYDGTTEVYDLGQDPYQLDGTASSGEAERVPALTRAVEELATCRARECDAVTGR